MIHYCEKNIYEIKGYPVEFCSYASLCVTSQWRHNGCDGVSNHRPRDCLLSRLIRRRSKKTPKLRVTDLCAGNSPVTGEFPTQMVSNADYVSIWRRHHDSAVLMNTVKKENAYVISQCFLFFNVMPYMAMFQEHDIKWVTFHRRKNKKFSNTHKNSKYIPDKIVLSMPKNEFLVAFPLEMVFSNRMRRISMKMVRTEVQRRTSKTRSRYICLPVKLFE